MNTSQRGVVSPSSLGKPRTIFAGKVSKPFVFSSMIVGDVQAVKDGSHKTIVPHQILNPEYNPETPRLKVPIRSPNSSPESHCSYSVSEADSSFLSLQRLPPKKQYRPRATRSSAACGSSSTKVSDDDVSTDTQSRKTIFELEAELIQEMSALKRLQLETEASRKVYNKTKHQMQLKVLENQQKAKRLVESVETARSSLEHIESAMPSLRRSTPNT